MTSVTTNGLTNRSQTDATPTASTCGRGETSAFGEVTPLQVQQWLNAGQAVLIDVRERDEYAREHIDGSRLLPLSRFDPGEAAALAGPGQKLVLQCRSGRRAADACRMASSLGTACPPMFTMTGGIEAWKKDNLPVTVDTRVSGVSVMRQVQLVIGTGVLAGSVLAWFVHPGFVAIPAFFGAGLTFAGATGTCALASLIGMMPWNKAAACAGSCSTGGCV